MLYVAIRCVYDLTNAVLFSPLFRHDISITDEQKKPDWSKGKPGDAKVKEEVEAEA